MTNNNGGAEPAKSGQMMGVWAGLAFYLLFFVACWPMAQFIPPPSPLLTGEELWAKYEDNLFLIRLSMPVGLLAGALICPFSAVLAIQIARLEGRIPFWAITCVGAGAANAVAFYLPFVFWAPVWYREGRSPELIQMFSDMTWLEFVMVWPPVAIQFVSVAMAGLAYKGPLNIFPRWFCYLSLWVALLLVPGSLIVLFTTGPFTWNGLLGWWTPLTAFAIYFLVLLWMTRKAVLNHAAEV